MLDVIADAHLGGCVMSQIVFFKRIVSVVLLLIFGLRGMAHAEGALAVGLAGDKADYGFVYGYAVKAATRDQAYNQALASCRSGSGLPEARAHCKVVAVFRNQCVAVAFDYEWGTSGVGWSVSDDIRVARNDAMTKCIATNGGEEGCEIFIAACDGPTAPAAKPPAKPAPQIR